MLRFVDPRRFGMLDLTPTRRRSREHPRLAGLGLEPLAESFTGPALAAVLAGRLSPLKIALMDQRLVVGVGNIYACESLHRAGLSPRRMAGGLRPAQAARLAAAIRAVLEEAIAAGGSSLRDYVQATASSASSRTASRSTAAPACRARAASGRSRSSSRRSARPSGAAAASAEAGGWLAKSELDALWRLA